MRIARNLLIFFVALVSIMLVGRSIDAAMEIDDLKSHIRLQKEAIAFLESANAQSTVACALSVEAFETVAKASKYASSKWNGDQRFVGPFQIQKRSDCITEMRLVGLP